MPVNEFMRSLVRRWYLVLGAVALTAVAGVLVGRSVPVTYTISTDVVLVPPKSTEDPKANPLLLMGGMGQAVDVLARAMESDAVRESVAEAGTGGDYTAVTDLTTSAPILKVTSEADSGAAAAGLLEQVVERVPGQLTRIQDDLGIADSARITSLEIRVDDEAEASRTGQIRAVAAACIVLLGVSLLLISAIDGLLLRRREQASTPVPTAPRAASGKGANANASTAPPRQATARNRPRKPARRG
jgi:hypothetical protein